MPGWTKNNQRQLSEADFGLRFMMDCLHVGFWDFDVATNNFRVTRTWRKIRGLDKSSRIDVSNDDWSDAIHPDDRHELLDVFNAQKTGDVSVVDIQFRHKHPVREWVWIQCRASVIARDENGKPLRIVGIDTEVSNLKKTEEETARLAEKLQLAVEVSGLGIFEFDPETMQTTWDDRMLDIYGVADGPHVHPHTFWETFLHPDDREQLVALTEESERLGLPVTSDYRIIRADGEVRHIRALSRRVKHKDSGERLVGINLDITHDMARTQELEEARRLLRHDALHDALTGLGNRRYFDETLASEAERANKEQRQSILAIDLDKFKELNDKLGHAAGDHALKWAAKTIEDCLPHAAQAFRVGGDEFMVLLKDDIGDEDQALLCETLISRLSEPFFYEGHTCQIGASIGHARGYATDGQTARILADADAALYAAKSAGRSCFRSFEKIDITAITNRGISDRELHQAVARGEFVCMFQPQFDAQSGEIVGAEALVRWQREDGHIFSPMQFLDQAANAGCLADIDRAVFMQVTEFQSAWHANGYQCLPISINVSEQRLKDQDFCRDLTTLVKPHHALSFELLETSNYDRLDDEVQFRIDTIREAGISIELDDFGTGKSSVLALQTILPDRIKIDRSLVAVALNNPERRSMLTALTQIGRCHGAQVLLEGVETLEMIDQARDFDCDTLQGFGMSPPVSLQDLQELIGIRSASTA